MIIVFSKTGGRTGAFLGDAYRSEYVFKTLNELPIASLTYANFKAAIKYNDTAYSIEPIMGFLTIKKYVILEEGAPIGQIGSGNWFNGVSVALSMGKEFNLKRRYKSLWGRLFNRTEYWVELQCEDELVSYKFTTGVGFERGASGRNRELTGQIDTDINNLPVSLFGVFLIEQLLADE